METAAEKTMYLSAQGHYLPVAKPDSSQPLKWWRERMAAKKASFEQALEDVDDRLGCVGNPLVEALQQYVKDDPRRADDVLEAIEKTRENLADFCTDRAQEQVDTALEQAYEHTRYECDHDVDTSMTLDGVYEDGWASALDTLSCYYYQVSLDESEF